MNLIIEAYASFVMTLTSVIVFLDTGRAPFLDKQSHGTLGSALAPEVLGWGWGSGRADHHKSIKAMWEDPGSELEIKSQAALLKGLLRGDKDTGWRQGHKLRSRECVNLDKEWRGESPLSHWGGDNSISYDTCKPPQALMSGTKKFQVLRKLVNR